MSSHDPVDPAPIPEGSATGPAGETRSDAGEPARYDSSEHPAPTGAYAPAASDQQAPRRRKRVTVALISGAAATALLLGGGGAAAGAVVTASILRDADSATFVPSSGIAWGAPPNSGFGGSSSSSGSQFTPGTFGTPSGESTSTTATASTDEEEVGVVTILTSIGYSGSAEAAGTGMVMTSDGLVLTNNHVIDGSTSIEVTVESTGQTYDATVVGSDSTADVAVLQLEDASGLATVAFDTDESTTVGDEVYSVGNAGGTGDLVTASGDVIATDQSITVQSESTGASESLSGLIEVDSDVVAGDSGGPLFDDDGDVIGIVTAASSGTTSIVGYAIDIDAALTVVEQIESGVETDTVQIGATPFLGVELSSAATQTTSTGVLIGGVVADMPAAVAGLVAGDTITAVDGTPVTSSDALSSAIAAHKVGDTLTVTWTDNAGVSHDASVALAAGPA